MPTLNIKWNTHIDKRSCKRCIGLNGYEWTFDTKVGFPRTLLHPTHGPVWDCDHDQSMAHGMDRRGRWNCRCQLTWTFDYSDIKQRVLSLIGEVEEWRRMGRVLIIRQKGRFVTWRRL